jgi:hypothetical protein
MNTNNQSKAKADSEEEELINTSVSAGSQQ